MQPAPEEGEGGAPGARGVRVKPVAQLSFASRVNRVAVILMFTACSLRVLRVFSAATCTFNACFSSGCPLNGRLNLLLTW
jgi:hypothetical protein